MGDCTHLYVEYDICGFCNRTRMDVVEAERDALQAQLNNTDTEYYEMEISKLVQQRHSLQAAITRIDTLCNDGHYYPDFRLSAAIKAAVELVELK